LRNQAGRHLAAVAVGFTGRGIATHLSRIGDVPVLTIEEPTGGPDPTTISVNPDLSGPGLPLECTFLWTPAPGMPPEAIADTIIAVLDAVRPRAAAHRPSDEEASPPMTATPAAAGQPGGDDLTARIFRALYQEFDLRAINGTYVAVPKGTPFFCALSLGDIARQISDYEYPGPSASQAGPDRSPLPRRQENHWATIVEAESAIIASLEACYTAWGPRSRPMNGATSVTERND
jgi:hypothetical protein